MAASPENAGGPAYSTWIDARRFAPGRFTDVTRTRHGQPGSIRGSLLRITLCDDRPPIRVARSRYADGRG